MRALLFIVAAGLCASHACGAGYIANAKVVSVRVDQSGQAMVKLDQPVAGTPPACVHPAYASSFGFNTNTAGGKSILATVLSAKATGSSLIIYGTGDCVTYGSASVEDWSYGELF